MSEVIVSPPGTQASTQFGLKVINTQPVRLNRNNPGDPVTAYGSAANDTIQANPATTFVSFNIQGGAGNDVLGGGSARDLLTGDAGDDTLSGGFAEDALYGGIGNDQILGGDGTDVIFGDDGNDNLQGDAGDDILTGAAGNDQLFGGDGADNLQGNDGNDSLDGGEGNDTLKGGAGNDTLTGGPGKNTLKGGAGKDVFQFNDAATGKGKLDMIKDFRPRQDEDRIEISKSLLPGSGLKGGKLSASDFAIVKGIGSAETDAKVIYDSNSGIVYYNPSSGVDVPLFQMKKNLDVVASDFKIIT
jgi:Ca2+-binding RTX toxin-like protein